MTDTVSPPFEEQKQYEFFLADIGQIRLPSGIKLKLVWRAVDSGVDVVEYSLMDENGIPGPRLLELLQRLKLLPVSMTNQVDSRTLFRRNTKLYAEIQRHFPSSKTEEVEYEFVYISITPEVAKVSKFTDSDRAKVKFRAGQVTPLSQLKSKIQSTDSHLLPLVDIMIKDGEVTLA